MTDGPEMSAEEIEAAYRASRGEQMEESKGGGKEDSRGFVVGLLVLGPFVAAWLGLCAGIFMVVYRWIAG